MKTAIRAVIMCISVVFYPVIVFLEWLTTEKSLKQAAVDVWQYWPLRK